MLNRKIRVMTETVIEVQMKLMEHEEIIKRRENYWDALITATLLYGANGIIVEVDGEYKAAEISKNEISI